MKKPRRDVITGIVGLLGCAFFLVYIQKIKMPPKLLEPGPRLLPYVAVIIIALSSVALIIQGIKDRDKEEKPYFPKGGIKKITKSFIMLCIYAVMLNFFGFLILICNGSFPFALCCTHQWTAHQKCDNYFFHSCCFVTSFILILCKITK